MLLVGGSTTELSLGRKVYLQAGLSQLAAEAKSCLAPKSYSDCPHAHDALVGGRPSAVN